MKNFEFLNTLNFVHEINLTVLVYEVWMTITEPIFRSALFSRKLQIFEINNLLLQILVIRQLR